MAPKPIYDPDDTSLRERERAAEERANALDKLERYDKELRNKEENPERSGLDSVDNSSEEPEDIYSDDDEDGDGEDESTTDTDEPTQDDTPFTYTREPKKRRLEIRKGVKKKLKRKTTLFFVGFLGIFAVAIIFISMYFSSLKIIQLAENITVWNLARSSRSLRLSQAQILEENIASETMTDSRYITLRDRFSATKVGVAIDKFNALRPSKVFQNLNRGFEPVYVTEGQTIFGKPKKVFAGYNYTSTDGTVTFIEKSNSKFFRVFQNSAERVRFAAETAAVIEKDLQGYKTYVRGSVLKKILADKGIKLRWWEKYGNKYKDLKQQAAERLAQQDEYNALKGEDSSCRIVQSVCDAAKETEDATKKALKDAVDDENGGGARSVENKVNETRARTLDGSVKATGVTRALEAASVVYAVAVPLCLIYEGSIENSADIIDQNELALQKQYFSVVTAADQQKAGESIAEAVGAFTGKIGDISDSVPQLRASNKIVDPSTQMNALELPESSSTGSYSLINVALGDGAAVDAMNKVADKGCGFITDLKVGITVAVLEFAASLFTGGGSAASEEAAATGVKLAMQNFVKRITFAKTRAMIEEKGVVFAFKNTLGKFLVKTGLTVGATLGLTELAKMAVLKHVKAANDGLSMDATFANQADMGGNLLNRDYGQQLLYGRPLTTPEVQASKDKDVAYIQELNSRKSFSERYFAVSNPSSFVSRVGMSISSFMSKPDTLAARIFGNLSDSLSALSNAFYKVVSPRKLFAASNTVSGAGDYNIVQWVWSEEEEAIILNNADYQPMANELILDASGKKDEIENKYKHCYEDSMGTMLAKGNIQREAEGQVIVDKGDCSPTKLGIQNNDGYGDLVFRWRLSKRNNNVYDHFRELQNPDNEVN